MLLVNDLSTRILGDESPPFRGVILASGVMAFSGLGDALLYPLLPVYGKEMGFSVFFIGILLSVNRFVRILINTPIANLVRKKGMKKVLIWTSALAVITTFTYSIKAGMISFLIARIIWGVCYSGLKIATLNYSAQAESKSGLAFGLSISIKTTGAFFSLFIGTMLVRHFGIENGLLIIGAISAVGVFLAVRLPENEFNRSAKIKSLTTFYPSPVNLLVFTVSIALDGILVVTLSALFLHQFTESETLLSIVAFYLLLKRLFVLVLSLASGFLTLRIDVIRIFNASVIFIIIGTLCIAFGFTRSGVVIAFLFNTFVVTYVPLVAIGNQRRSNALQAISSVSTWWDLGAALGAFLGMLLIEKLGVSHLYLIISVLIIFAFSNFKYHNYGSSGRRTI